MQKRKVFFFRKVKEMDLRVMKNFLKIAETENITQSSRELNVAQPHLTRQIKALEEELGVLLFQRDKKRLHITEEGRFLKQQAEQILRLVEKTERQVKEMQSEISGTLFLGTIETIGESVLPDWAYEFKNRFPEIKFNIWSANSKDVVERLSKGLLDLAVVREPIDETKFNSIHLATENWTAFFNRNHILSQKSGEKISLAELSKEELMVPIQRVDEVEKWFREKNLKANIKCAFSPMSIGMHLLSKNLGVVILPKSAGGTVSKDKILMKELSDNKPSGISLIWKKGYELPLAAKNFKAFLQEKYPVSNV